jgi:hypothetical protein
MSPGAKLGLLIGAGLGLWMLGRWLFLKLTQGGPRHDPTGPRGSDTWNGDGYDPDGNGD